MIDKPMTQFAEVSSGAPVLVVGPAWIGDMVMAQSLYRLLKTQRPSRPIDVVAPAWSQPLLDRMPEIRKAYMLGVGHGEFGLTTRWRLGRELHEIGYGWSIVLPRSLKSAIVPWAARIPRRTGFLGEQRWGLLNDIRRLHRKLLPTTVQRFVSLGLEPGQPVTTFPHPRLVTSEDGVREALGVFALTRDRPILALCPGAEYGPAKRWPAPHYADLARRRLRGGWQVWLFGSDKDRPVTGAIAREAPGVADLAGRTTLAQAIDLLSVVDAVVSNDSGLMHVAAALGRPLVAIYGSSDPGYTPPLTDRCRVVWLHLACSPCFKRDCPLGHTNCLWQVGPDQVDGALNALLPASTSR